MPGRDPQAYPKLLTLQAISTNLISRIQNTPQSATEALGLQGTRRNSRRLGFRKLRPPSTLARSYHTRIGAGAVQAMGTPTVSDWGTQEASEEARTYGRRSRTSRTNSLAMLGA